MIFVTIGTQLPFDRLIKIIDELAPQLNEEVIAQVYQCGFTPKNIKTVEALRSFGLQFEEKEVEKLSDTLSGMTIMITGNYSISRDLMKQYIEAHGGKVGSSVSSSTTYLLAGNKAGASKLQKAEKLGIPVISEEEFYKIANPNGEEYTLF